jgi:hypothetical protein
MALIRVLTISRVIIIVIKYRMSRATSYTWVDIFFFGLILIFPIGICPKLLIFIWVAIVFKILFISYWLIIIFHRLHQQILTIYQELWYIVQRRGQAPYFDFTSIMIWIIITHILIVSLFEIWVVDIMIFSTKTLGFMYFWNYTFKVFFHWNIIVNHWSFKSCGLIHLRCSWILTHSHKRGCYWILIKDTVTQEIPLHYY